MRAGGAGARAPRLPQSVPGRSGAGRAGQGAVLPRLSSFLRSHRGRGLGGRAAGGPGGSPAGLVRSAAASPGLFLLLSVTIKQRCR